MAEVPPEQSSSSVASAAIPQPPVIRQRLGIMGLLGIITALILTVVFLYFALNSVVSPQKTSSSPHPAETEAVAGIPRQEPCPEVTPAASSGGKLLYQDTTSCFYFYFPPTYEQYEGDLVDQHVTSEDVDLQHVRVRFAWNTVTPDAYKKAYETKDGEELNNVASPDGTTAYKVKNVTLGNTKGVMYVVEFYENDVTNEINDCRRFFLVETGATITTIEDKLSLVHPPNCSGVRTDYPKNDLDKMLESLSVYR